MRTAPILVLLVLLTILGVAAAQDPRQPPGGGACGGFQPQPGDPNAAARPPGGNGTFRGARGEPLPALNLTLDPAMLTLRPGESATVALVLRNDGAAPLALNLSGGGFRGGARPAPVTASLDASEITVDPGATATVGVTVSVSSDAPAGCRQSLPIRAQEAGTNRSAQARLDVEVPAAAPVAVSDTAAASTTAETPTAKTVSAPGALLSLLGAACLVRRR
jgi:hypothetical protein